MGATPQRNQNYNRLQMPLDQAAGRTRPVPNIEYLDRHRAAKLAAQKKEKELEYYHREEPVYAKPRAVEGYQRAKAPVSAPPKKYAGKRKITAAYEVKTRARSYDRAVNNGYKAYQQEIEINEFYYNMKPQQQAAPKRRPVQSGQPVRNNQAGGSRQNRSDMQFDASFDIRPDGTAVIRETAAPAAPREKEKKAAVKKASRTKGIASTIFAIAVVFMMLSAVLVNYANLSEVVYNNAQTESNIKSLQQELDKLQMDKAQKLDLGSIQQRASELGMAHPTDEQIRFVTPSAEPKAVEYPTDLQGIATAEAAEAAEAQADSATAGDGPLSEIAGFFSSVVNTIKGWIE